MKKIKDNLNSFLTVKNETLTSADLYFYGEIVSDWWGAWLEADQYPDSIRDFLKKQEGKKLNIYINSEGGSVFAGFAIYNMLKRHTGFKTVYVDGIAASIASVIALAGDRVIIPSNAYIMIHKPYVKCTGNADELRKNADDLDAVEVGILNTYKENLSDGIDISEIQNMMNAETWLNGEEASKYFRKVESAPAKEYVAKVTDFTAAYKNIPKEIIASAQAVDNKSADTAEKIKRLYLQALTKGEI